MRTRYRIRSGRPKLATNAHFFEEGHSGDYVNARDGEFRVAAGGEAILAGLRDEGFVRLRTPPTEAPARR